MNDAKRYEAWQKAVALSGAEDQPVAPRLPRWWDDASYLAYQASDDLGDEAAQ